MWQGLGGNSPLNNMNIIREGWPWFYCQKGERKENTGRKMDNYVLLTRLFHNRLMVKKYKASRGLFLKGTSNNNSDLMRFKPLEHFSLFQAYFHLCHGIILLSLNYWPKPDVYPFLLAKVTVQPFELRVNSSLSQLMNDSFISSNS